MKKVAKIIFIISFAIFILLTTTLIYCSILVSDIKFDKNKLINVNKSIDFYDVNNNLIYESSNGQSVEKIENIPEHTKNAFIAIEDKRFYQHNGLDYKGLFRAAINNIKNFSFKEGASTISQQLIKNTHLSNEKTLKRKIAEVKLTRELEKKLTKNEILETYLNTIYFGNGCYGITNASKYYFNKTPDQLSIGESATLAAIIKAPANYSPNKNANKCLSRRNIILKSMLDQSLITKEQFQHEINQPISLTLNTTLNHYNYFDYVKSELDEIIKNSPYKYKKLKIYTNYDQNIQANIEDLLKTINKNFNFSIIICDNSYNIIAYTSSHLTPTRQSGSIIKPLLCYAPAVEENKIEACSPLLDEKTDFNGYTPSNYSDKYYGYISARKALATSSNVCAVKVLNYVGINTAKEYTKKLNINYSENDNSLSLALGSSEKGINFNNIVNAYGVFQNQGKFKNFSTIKKITTKNDEIIYENTTKTKNVFTNETVSVINDMLSETVKNGTAKKLNSLNYNLYAKTGTVGNSSGNTDAYCISYSKNHLIGVWIGNNNNTLLQNNITGGTMPTNISYSIWKDIYKNNSPQKIPVSDKLYSVKLDLNVYQKENLLALADINAPERYVLNELVKNPNIINPSKNQFTNPKIEKLEYSYNNNVFSLSLCHAEYIGIKIFREENSKKIEVFDTNINGDYFVDKNHLPNTKYSYYYLPYYKNNDNIFYGTEEKITTIKTPAVNFNDWWELE